MGTWPGAPASRLPDTCGHKGRTAGGQPDRRASAPCPGQTGPRAGADGGPTIKSRSEGRVDGMSTQTTKAVILLDIDGVLNPFLRCRPPFCRCHRHWRRFRTHPDGYLSKIVLNPAHGRLLRALAAETDSELVWSTMWQEHANDWVGPRLGLPALPCVPIPPLPSPLPVPRPGSQPSTTLGAWKARHVAAWAKTAGRPFVWFDDEIDVTEHLSRHAGARPFGPHLVVQVDGRTGLTDDHLNLARIWLTATVNGT